MHKIEYKKFDETYYEDVCDNGLKIVVFHKPLYNSTSCLFGTNFGSFDLKQIDENNTEYNFLSGIAHFLEHKLFESDKGDALSEFSSLGANVNAFTSYKETVYYFSTAAENIDKPLNLLLDFVQDLNISEESVEKEKGIIVQELMMYLQNPDSRLFFETLKSMYHNHPLKEDIGGDEESVNKISKYDLERCYKLNYHPSNMLIVVVSNKNPDEIINLIKKNQNNKNFEKSLNVKRIYDNEPETVVEKEKIINMDVNESKCCLGIKLKVKNEEIDKRIKREWALSLALESYFSSLNPKFQTWLDENKITSYFSFEHDLGENHALILFNDVLDNSEDFRSFIIEEFENFKKIMIKEETLNIVKNKNLGQMLRSFNNLDNIAVAYFRSYMNNISLFKNFSILKEITIKDCFEAVNELDISNNTLTILKNVNIEKN